MLNSVTPHYVLTEHVIATMPLPQQLQQLQTQTLFVAPALKVGMMSFAKPLPKSMLNSVTNLTHHHYVLTGHVTVTKLNKKENFMAVVSTTDVVTNPNTSLEAAKNGTCVVTCTPTGSFHTIDATYETSMTYTELETLLTSRFDDVAYYNAVDGGTP
jgi:hypothetical protein